MTRMINYIVTFTIFILILFKFSLVEIYGQNSNHYEKNYVGKIKAVDSLNKLCTETWNNDTKQALKYADLANKMAKNFGYDKGEAQALKNSGNVYLFMGEYDSAISRYNQSIELYTKLKDKQGIASCNNNIGMVHERLGNYRIALDFYHNSLEYEINENNIEGLAKSYHNIGNIYYHLGDYDQCLKYYNLSFRNFDLAGIQVKKAEVLINTGVVLESQQQYQNAINTYQEALKYASNPDSKYIISLAYHNLGHCYLFIGNLKISEDFLTKALVLKDQLGDPSGMSAVLKSMGKLYEKRKEYIKAADYYYQSLNIIEDLKEKKGIAETFTLIGENLLQSGNVNKAVDYFQQSLEIASEIGARREIMENFKFLAMAYAAEGYYEKSLEYIAQYSSLKDSLSIDIKKPISEENQAVSDKKWNNILLIRWISISAGIVIFLTILLLFMSKRKRV